MPGLTQLKKFKQNMLDLANEKKIRAESGEKPVEVSLPEGISDADDSDDFINGLPTATGDKNNESNSLDSIDDIINSPDAEDTDSTEPEDSDDDLMAGLGDDVDMSGFEDDASAPADSLDGLGDLGDLDAPSHIDIDDFQDTPASESAEESLNADDIGNIDIDNLDDFGDNSTSSVDSTIDSVDSEPEISPLDTTPEDTSAVDFDTDALDGGDFDNHFGENPASESSDDLSSGFDMENIADSLNTADSTDSMTGFEASDSDFSSGAPNDQDASSADFDSVSSSEPQMEDFSDAMSEAGADDIDFGKEFMPTGSAGGFELDNDVGGFDIEGFTDREYAQDNKKKPAEDDSAHPKNTFTDREYEQFKKNFAEYPLNVRLAIEKMIDGDQFNDDAVFEVLEKVLKKVPARQLAGFLEKLLDTTISVPRDFEKRTAAEYEAYKQSAEYLLKNKILPGIIVGVAALIVLVTLGMLGRHFVVRPLIASSLYKKGYTLLQENAYPEAEEKFKQAVSYRPKKGWFYRYAEAYRDHKQHRRAAEMYQRTLRYFKQDKKAGLDYATMELEDYEDYAEAERIVLREVLDFHINDSDGMLLLGDIYLEWGTEKDPEKLEEAREQYTRLQELYNKPDLYQSRMMRYYIRNDSLYEVLQCKNQFYPRKKSLGGEDWTELSGYLLDKLYGTLKPNEVYLRESIEDVRDLLERAIAFSPNSPVAHYNMGRYFVNTDNTANARYELDSALKLFGEMNKRKKSETYKYIDSYRLLGEQFIKTREYIRAEEILGNGITFYEQENHNNGFVGDQNTGILYADRGDLDYFITGDINSALRNYKQSVALGNDTASIRYKSGFVEYMNRDYDAAMLSFIHAAEMQSDDTHLLLALGNTLSLRGDNFAAQGYYDRLMDRLDFERSKHDILLPQVREDQGDIVDLYMRAANNLGVTEYRLARQTGDSRLNADAIANLSVSARAYDALTRNQQTMVRLDGSNLAMQNSKYMTQSKAAFEPEIYTEISRTLTGEKGFEE